MMEQKLKDIILNKTTNKYDSRLKTLAIFALSERALLKGLERDYFFPIFLTREENHEVRIAAFDVLMRGAPTTRVG